MNQLSKKLLIVIATVCALFCLGATSAFAMGTDVQQTNHDVNLRTGPGTQYDVITVVPVGSTVIIQSQDSGWDYIQYNDNLGWVYAQYLGAYAANTTASAPAASVGSITNYSTTADVNLRSGPGTSYDVYIVLPAGSTIGVDGVTDGWAHCYYGNYEGYVFAQYVNGLGTAGSVSKGSGSTASTGTTWYGGHNYANVYDYAYYCANNKDVVAALGTNPKAILQHFVNYGMSEGRQGISSFNVYSYRDAHPDLNARFHDDLRSYYLYACGII
jgi:uncharacterized protein YraI